MLHPAYDYLYALEANGYPTLGYHPSWAVEDPRYIPQSLGVALFGLPDVLPRFLPDSLAVDPIMVCTEPGAARGLFDLACPLAVPRDTGMSVLLTSPAYLLAVPMIARYGRSRLATGAVHRDRRGLGRQPDALQPGLGPVRLPVQQRRRRRSPSRWWSSVPSGSPAAAPGAMPLAAALIVVSVAINLWGVAWSRLLGW